MPVNKAARFRFEIIDECLRNTKKKWSKVELLKHVNRRLELQYGESYIISISQLRYDLENMQSEYSAPIEMYKNGKNYYYRYEDLDFSIKNIPINEDEITALNTAVCILKQLKGFTIADEIADIVHKLESRYNFNIEDQKNIIIFENAENLTGKETLEDLYHAIIRKNVLKISYCPLHSNIHKIYNIHPYMLKEYGDVWHIVGYCQETQKIGAFELDRIKEIKISNLPYIMDLFLTVENYFQHIIGITKPSEEVQIITLLFTKYKASYILLHPIHHSQEIIKNYANGNIEVSVRVIVNQEFVNLILSYGHYVKVLSPKTLVTEISKIAEKIVKYYAIHRY